MELAISVILLAAVIGFIAYRVNKGQSPSTGGPGGGQIGGNTGDEMETLPEERSE